MNRQEFEKMLSPFSFLKLKKIEIHQEANEYDPTRISTYYEARFTSPARIVRLRVAEGLGNFNLSIENPMPPRNKRGHFSLTEYYKDKHPSFDIDKATHQQPGEPFDAFCQRAIAFAVRFLQDEIPGVIAGTEWLDILMDWLGYR